MKFCKQNRLDRRTVNIAAIIIAVGIVIALALLSLQLHNRIQPTPDDSQDALNALAQGTSHKIDTENLTMVQAQENFNIGSADMSSIPETDNICRFSLALPDVLVLPGKESDLVNMNAELVALRDCDDGDLPNTTSFVFINTENGKAISYNAGLPMYPASSVKAMFCYYLLSVRADELTEYDRQLIENAILYSDNDSYAELVYEYSNEDTMIWFSNYGITFTDFTIDLYPMLSVKSASRIWRDILVYIDTGSDDAVWFKDMLANTSVSFARDAVTNMIGASMLETGDVLSADELSFDESLSNVQGDKITVYNKAGWIVDWEVNGLADCGIICDEDGTRYIFAFMTDAAESEETILAFENLLKTAWDTRSILS